MVYDNSQDRQGEKHRFKDKQQTRAITRSRIITVMFALLAVLLYKPLSMASEVLGIGRQVPTLGMEKCRRVEGPVYCEDGVVDHATGLIFLTCDPMRRRYNTVMDSVIIDDTLTDGKIWLYDIEESNATPIHIPLEDLPVPFHPLGITIDTAISTSNNITLLVANVAPGGPWIHILRFTRDTSTPRLHHVKTIRDSRIHTPNSIHIVPYARADDGTPSFFFSNDHTFVTGLPKLLENYLLLPLANLAFYNARLEETKTVWRGLRFANGIAGPTEGNYFYLAETYNIAIKRFEVANVKTMREGTEMWPTLRFEGAVSARMPVDNLHYDEKTGDVYVGGYPTGGDLLKFARATLPKGGVPKGIKWYPEGLRRPASTVMKVSWKGDGLKPVVETILSDGGMVFTTTSTAMVDNERKRMVVTGLYEYGILDCLI